jgi:hypothetical protein
MGFGRQHPAGGFLFQQIGRGLGNQFAHRAIL